MKLNKQRLILICIIVFFSVSMVYRFRFDLFTPSHRYTSVSSTLFTSDRTKKQIVLLDEAPLLSCSRQKQVEEIFWRNNPLDSLLRYRYYEVSFYRRTEYLTPNFREGEIHENPTYVNEQFENIMEWRSHLRDRIGRVSLITRDDGTGNYYVTIYDSGYGFDFIVDVSLREYFECAYSSVHQLSDIKYTTLGITKLRRN